MVLTEDKMIKSLQNMKKDIKFIGVTVKALTRKKIRIV